jgi:DNA-binding CsgD family transcriptional regulator
MTAIRRVLATMTDPLQRLRFLPASVEILLEGGDLEGARRDSEELDAIAARLGGDVLAAIAAHARGAVRLAEGDAEGALGPLGDAFRIWQNARAPYLAARVRVLRGRACRALADADGAKLEFDAARTIFEGLDAAPDLASLKTPAPNAQGLTPRELEVLRLVATGQTNRAIARQLCLSEKTIDRHLSNIFTKVNVSSRAAATAYAYRNHLV